jgi:hypothetical protein
MVRSKRREGTTVVRISKDAYDEAQKLREQFLKKPRNRSDPFALLAIAGISAFIGGLVGYAIANLRQSQQSQNDEESKQERGE